MNYKPILPAVLIFGAFGCTVITDFPAEWIDDTDAPQKYILSENISESEPVEVLLLDNENAEISLVLASALPLAEGGDSELASLLGETIVLSVQNQEGGTTVDLTQGIQVVDLPDAAGEYRITLNPERTVITVTFTNETVSGKSLNIDGDYQALISVLSNDYFETEDFVRDVEVTL